MIYLAILLAVAQAQTIKILTLTKGTYSDPACTTRFVLNSTDPWIAQQERGYVNMVQCGKNWNHHCTIPSSYGFTSQTCTCSGTLGQLKAKGVAVGPFACTRASTCWDTTISYSGRNRRIYLGESYACEDIDYRVALAEWNYVIVQNGTCASHGYSDVPAKVSTPYDAYYKKVVDTVSCDSVAQLMPEPAHNCTGLSSSDCRKEKDCVFRPWQYTGNNAYAAICQFDASKKTAVKLYNVNDPSGCFFDTQTNTVVYNRGGQLNNKRKTKASSTLNAVCYDAPAPTERPTAYPTLPAPTRQPVMQPVYKSYDEYLMNLKCTGSAQCTDQGAKNKKQLSLCPESWAKNLNRRCVARKEKKGIKCRTISPFYCTRFSGCKQKVYGKSKCKGKHKW